METLLVVDQHRGRYNGKNRGHGSPSSRVFREINCRTFQSGVGILPTPVKAWKPVRKPGFGDSPSVGSFGKTSSAGCGKSVVEGKRKSAGSFVKTPSPECVKSVVEGKHSGRKSRSVLKKSSSVPTPFSVKVNSDEKFLYCKKLSYSELWAGPAYSNSPPPSSLPMPKFSVPPKRSASLELPSSEPDVHLHQGSRSAPPSPKRDHASSGRNVFHSADYASATRDLRRILNLNMDDE